MCSGRLQQLHREKLHVRVCIQEGNFHYTEMYAIPVAALSYQASSILIVCSSPVEWKFERQHHLQKYVCCQRPVNLWSEDHFCCDQDASPGWK